MLDAIELTGGSSLANPMYLFRGEAPLREFGATLPRRVRLGFSSSAAASCGAYPFEEAFFLPYARQFLRRPVPPAHPARRYHPLDTVDAALAEGFAFVAMARALLREPDLVHRMEAGRATSSLCIHCNQCMPTIYSGTRCVLVADAPATPSADTGAAGRPTAPPSRAGRPA